MKVFKIRVTASDQVIRARTVHPNLVTDFGGVAPVADPDHRHRPFFLIDRVDDAEVTAAGRPSPFEFE